MVTTVICTDKTGTLTQNEMTVCELWLEGQQLTVTGVGYAPEGEILEQGRPVAHPVAADVRQLLVAAGLCNDARILPPNALASHWTILGDPTEAALRVVASKGGIDLEAEAQLLPRLRELPFDARRKRMSTVHQLHAKMFQTCGSATLAESGRSINAREGSDDHASAARPPLPRKR